MARRIISTTLVATALAASTMSTAAGTEVIDLRLPAHYLSAPATVRMIVYVEPHAANRTLRIEMDGVPMFRATMRTLEGAADKRVHEVEFKGVPAGEYRVTAAVLSANDVRGTAIERVAVLGLPPAR